MYAFSSALEVLDLDRKNEALCLMLYRLQGDLLFADALVIA